jgi:hypothetical protein
MTDKSKWCLSPKYCGFPLAFIYPNILHWSIFGLTKQHITDIWEKDVRSYLKPLA